VVSLLLLLLLLLLPGLLWGFQGLCAGVRRHEVR
jgi:hypothetical protein